MPQVFDDITLTQPEIELRAACALAKDDHRAYVRLMIAAVDVDAFCYHPFQDLISDSFVLCMKEQKICNIVAPPEHTKSTQLRHLLSYIKAKNPRARICLTAADTDLSQRTLTGIRKTILSPINQAMFPNMLPDRSRSQERGQWTQNTLYMHGDVAAPSFEIAPFWGEFLGARVDLFVFDDIATQEGETSSSMRDRIDARCHGTFLNRLTDGGVGFFLNNTWHREDTPHRLANSTAAHTLWIGYSGTDEIYWWVKNPVKGWPHGSSGTFPLWHEVWPKERLEKKYAANPHAYRKLFGGKALTREEMKFPPVEEWKTWNWDDLRREYARGANLYAFTDIASGRTLQRNDYAACCVVMVDQNKRLYWLDVWCARAGPDAQAKVSWHLHEKWAGLLGGSGIYMSYLEFPTNMAVGNKDDSWGSRMMTAIEKELRESGGALWDMNWMVVYQPSNVSKWPRIEEMAPKFVSGQILVPPDILALQASDPSWRVACTQIEEFPPKGIGDHDDAPDALSGAVKAARQLGPGLSAQRAEYQERMLESKREIMVNHPLTGKPLVEQVTRKYGI